MYKYSNYFNISVSYSVSNCMLNFIIHLFTIGYKSKFLPSKLWVMRSNRIGITSWVSVTYASLWLIFFMLFREQIATKCDKIRQKYHVCVSYSVSWLTHLLTHYSTLITPFTSATPLMSSAYNLNGLYFSFSEQRMMHPSSSAGSILLMSAPCFVSIT